MKILKRQIFCGKRPRRGYRNRPTTNCPVLVEEIGTEAITDTPRKPQLSVVRLETVAVLETTSTSLSEDLPEIEQSAPATPDLDQVIEWLALLPDEGIQEVLALARLEQKRRRLRNSLESRLESKSKAR
ncbi:hypothetical protein JST97_00205 [bacterium]|nr:hypothetical protein [bacterium]